MAIILMVICEHYIDGYWWLLITIIFVIFGGYYINGYCWLFY